jgi:hypothetical protein
MTIGERPAAGATPAASGPETGPGREVQCALCGYRFRPSAETMSCAGCPIDRRCRVICCPNCGYEFPGESLVVEFFRRLFRR